jgi:hypothetical protein
MTVEVPEAWAAKWQGYDQIHAMIVSLLENGGSINCLTLSAFFRSAAGGPPWKQPSFMVWAAIRHNCATFMEMRDQLTESEEDTD